MDGLSTAWVANTMRARGYEVREGPDVPVTGGAADSRNVAPGQLFVAFPGEHTDGNLHVAAALDRGAVGAICNEAPAGEWPGKTLILAADTIRAAAQLAAAWREACGPRVVGITGTVGKTTAKDLTAAVVGTAFRTHKSEGNLNSREGLPLALLSLGPEHEVSILELGMDSKGEIAELCAIAAPEIGVVLNIGLTHVSKLGSIEAIAEEKLTLARHLGEAGTAVVNMDDRRISPAAIELRCRVIGFGECSRAALRRGPVEDHGLDGSSFDVAYQGEKRRAHSPLPGAHIVPAALAAMGVGLALGMELGEVIEALGRVPATGRITRRRAGNGATILDDRYNASPASVAGALGLLRGLPGRRIALLGKMAELGDYELAEHQRVGTLAAVSCDILVCFGPIAQALASAARAANGRDVRWFETKEAAAEAIAAVLEPGDMVLVKGSRSEALETIMPILEGAQ